MVDRAATRRIRAIAWRDFRYTALTKSFLIGAILLPGIMFVAIPLLPMLIGSTSPPLQGRVVVIDPSNSMANSLEKSLPKTPQDTMNLEDDPSNSGPTEVALTVENVTDQTRKDEFRLQLMNSSLQALIIVTPNTDGPSVELLVPSEASPRHTTIMEKSLREAVTRMRVEQAQEDFDRMTKLMGRAAIDTRRVSPDGLESKENAQLRMLVPAGFMFLLWISVFTSGNYLLTSTIEEKSSRVMEVLLSAASPIELLTGKLVGQAGVAGVMLLMYGGVGLAGLGAAAMLDVVPLPHLLWLLVWFPLAYFTVAAIMVSIGSAVSDLREAQSLIGPAMMVLILPLILWMPIVDNPNGTLATVCSFMPPAAPFVMILRLTAANEPVPMWQAIAAVLVSASTVGVILWAGARIFRVGVLMQGKPPSPMELLRWIKAR
ncbi:MAG: ABC transporter permease [Planctomycetota bacterium]|nr:MAG: ABC transporter permease [Planctomycetota bacterium]